MSLTYFSFLKFNFTFCSLFVGCLPFPLSRLHSGTSPTAADAPDGLLAGGAASAILRVSRGHWDGGLDSSASPPTCSSVLPRQHVDSPQPSTIWHATFAFPSRLQAWWRSDTFSSGEKLQLQ